MSESFQPCSLGVPKLDVPNRSFSAPDLLATALSPIESPRSRCAARLSAPKMTAPLSKPGIDRLAANCCVLAARRLRACRR